MEERAELLRHGLGRVDEGVEIVERRSQVHERRVGAAHEGRQPSDRLGQRGLLVAERPGGRVEVADQSRQVVAAAGERRDEPGAVDEEALEHGRVLGQLVEQPAGGGQGRVEVLEADVRLVAASLELPGLVLEEVLEALARLRIERVEELVEVDRRRGLVRADRASVIDLFRAVRREGQLDVAVGDARQGRLADGRVRARVQRLVLVVDLHLDVGLAVVRDRDVLDRADRHAPDLHRVALYELPAVVELRGDRVRVVAGAEEHDRDKGNSGDDRTKCGHASDPADRSHIPAFSSRPTAIALLAKRCPTIKRPASFQKARLRAQVEVARRRRSVKPVLRGALPYSVSGSSEPGQLPVTPANARRAPWSAAARVARKIAPSSAAAAISFPQEMRRYSLSGGSRSSISPHTWSNSFLASKPAIMPPMMLKGAKTSRDMDAQYY